MGKKAYGFTIVELLIVIVVIAILAAISIVAFSGIQTRAAESALQADLRNAATSLGVSYADDSSYPDTDNGLKRSTGTTFQYSVTGSAYCLTATSSRAGAKAYHVASGSGVREGTCTGHGATAGGASGFASRNGFTNLTESYGTGDTIRAPIGNIPNGSWMIVVLTSYVTSDHTPPSGWTVLAPRQSTNTLNTSIFAKIKTAADTPDQDFEAAEGSGRLFINGVLLWGAGSAPLGAWTVGSFGDRSVNATSTTAVTPTITTTAANSLVLSIAAERTNADETNYSSLTGVSPWIWIPQPTGNVSKNQTIAIGYHEQSTPGVSQAMTVTYPNSQAANATAVQIAIPPAT